MVFEYVTCPYSLYITITLYIIHISLSQYCFLSTWWATCESCSPVLMCVQTGVKKLNIPWGKEPVNTLPFHFKAHSPHLPTEFLQDEDLFSLLFYFSLAHTPVLWYYLNKLSACEPCLRPCFGRDMSWAWPLWNGTQMLTVSVGIMVSIMAKVFWSLTYIRHVVKRAMFWLNQHSQRVDEIGAIFPMRSRKDKWLVQDHTATKQRR